MDDHELLRRFVQGRSQDAFRELVERHLPMVHSVARRIVNDGHLAEEVAQEVFKTLAQKSESLRPPQVIGGWLYNTVRHLAMHTVRGEQRRREREQTAVAMQALETTPDESRIAEHLEPAMAELEADERDVLVLRFLEDRNLREVGAEFGISEDAARMRVNRALERLRQGFARQGITASSILLGTALVSSTTSIAVPSSLAAAITTTTLAGTITAATLATQATTTTMNWINAKAIAATLAAAVLAGTGTYLVQEKQVRRLEGEKQSLATEFAKLKTEHETTLALAQSREEELERVRKDLAELLRLRSEVGQLRREAEAAKRQASSPPLSAPRLTQAVGHPPGTYIARDQLAFAGYATPEAALESTTWAMMNGTYEQVNEALAPAMRDQESNDPTGRTGFETRQKMMAPLFKGLQILAKKVLSEDKVELKTRMDADPLPNQRPTPSMLVQPMVKVGNEWKLGGSTREYKEKWDQDGQIQAYAP